MYSAFASKVAQHKSVFVNVQINKKHNWTGQLSVMLYSASSVTCVDVICVLAEGFRFSHCVPSKVLLQSLNFKSRDGKIGIVLLLNCDR